MTNIEKLNDIFIEVFNVEISFLNDNFRKDNVVFATSYCSIVCE